jgi:hypothetical protein
VRLSGLQKVLWVLAGAAAFVFIWLFLWFDYFVDQLRDSTGELRRYREKLVED